jgi:hypothetical protein
MALPEPSQAKVQAGPGGPPPGSVGQLNDQLDQARALREQQASTISDLQAALSAGDITRDEYYQATGQLYDAQLSQLQGDLQEQGRPGAAAAVPVGIGTSNKPPEAFVGEGNDAGAFGPPPDVQFQEAVPGGPGGAPSSILFGPTNRPGEAVTTPNLSARNLPQAVLDSIPALVKAAQSPDATEAVKALARLVDLYSR